MVRVDTLLKWPNSRGGLWCHMFSDTGNLKELHELAKKIGLKRGWFQPHASLPHYDLRPSKRILALRFGAKEATREDLVAAIHDYRELSKS